MILVVMPETKGCLGYLQEERVARVQESVGYSRPMDAKDPGYKYSVLDWSLILALRSSHIPPIGLWLMDGRTTDYRPKASYMYTTDYRGLQTAGAYRLDYTPHHNYLQNSQPWS